MNSKLYYKKIFRLLFLISLSFVAICAYGYNYHRTIGINEELPIVPDSIPEIINLDTYGSGHFLEGEIVDEVTRAAIENETKLTLLTEDSTEISNVLTLVELYDGTASFLVEIPKSGIYILRFANSSYHTLYKKIRVNFFPDEHLQEVGKVAMKRKNMTEKVHVLEEVVVKATQVKFFFKNDTLVYNADVFTTQKGFVLTDILRKMPGIVLEEDGQIYANGKKVDVLLLEGKNFFNRDRKTILDNLPAFMVKNVKVYDTQNDSLNTVAYNEKAQGHIMNIVLKPDYHNSALGNIDLAFGTDKRYDGQVFGLKFNDMGRLSFSANGNNLNKNETIGSDGEVRSRTIYKDYENICDKMSLRYDTNNRTGSFAARGEVEYIYEDKNKENSSLQHIMVGDASMNNISFVSNNEYKNVIRTYQILDFFKNSSYSFSLTPSIQFSRSRINENNVTASFSKDVTAILGANWKDSIKSSEICKTMMDYGLSRGFYNTKEKKEKVDIGLLLSKHYVFPYTRNGISLQISVNYKNNEMTPVSISQIDYIEESGQKINNYYNFQSDNIFENNISVSSHYLLGMFHSMSLEYSFKYLKQDIENSYYALHNLNATTTEFTLKNLPSADILKSVKDIANSYGSTTQRNHHLIKWLYEYQKEGTHLNVEVPFRIEYSKFSYAHTYNDTLVKRKLIKPDVSVDFGQVWNDGEGKSISYGLSYKLTNEMPKLLDLINRIDDTNPLYVQQGNSELKNPINHVVGGDFFFQRRLDIHRLNLSYSLQKNDIVYSQLINDKTGGIVLTPQNASCNKYFYLNLSNKVYLPKNLFNIFSNFEFNHNQFKDFIDVDTNKMQEEKTVRQQQIKEKFGVGFTSRNTKYMASCNGYITYNRAKSDIETIGNTNVCDYGIRLETSIECPWNFRFRSDFTTVNRHGYNIDNDKTKELIWNASLSKSFSENITLGIECFDIFNQRKLLHYYVTGQSRYEVRNNGVRRYGMLRFIYRLNSSKKHSNNEHHNHSH